MWAGFQPVSMRKLSSRELVEDFDRAVADDAAGFRAVAALAVEPLERNSSNESANGFSSVVKLFAAGAFAFDNAGATGVELGRLINGIAASSPASSNSGASIESAIS